MRSLNISWLAREPLHRSRQATDRSQRRWSGSGERAVSLPFPAGVLSLSNRPPPRPVPLAKKGRPHHMSAVFCKLQLLLPAGRRPRPRLSRPQPADSDWNCLELAGKPGTSSLEAVRELVVRDPAALTAEVLAAAPDLLSVVLPEHCRLPAPIAAELGRRQIATVWRLPGFLAVSGRDESSQAGSGESGPTGSGSVSRRGSQP